MLGSAPGARPCPGPGPPGVLGGGLPPPRIAIAGRDARVRALLLLHAATGLAMKRERPMSLQLPAGGPAPAVALHAQQNSARAKAHTCAHTCMRACAHTHTVQCACGYEIGLYESGRTHCRSHQQRTPDEPVKVRDIHASLRQRLRVFDASCLRLAGRVALECAHAPASRSGARRK